jgi:RAB6A-GEF complex partner protein 1
MVGTNTNKIIRICWEDGKEDVEYTLDLRSIPFGINQHVNYAVPIEKNNVYVAHMDYSPLLGGFAITLSDGRAAFVTAINLKFNPNVSLQSRDKAINSKYIFQINSKQMAFGRRI